MRERDGWRGAIAVIRMNEFDSIETPKILARVEAVAAKDDSREGDERWALIRELHRRGGRTVFEQGLTWCESANSMVRCLGADVLAQLRFAEGYPFADESTPVLVALLEDTEPAVIASALTALGHLGTGDSAKMSVLASHASDEVRHSLAYCLGRRDEPIARETLIVLSRDRDPEVRDWATFGLGSLSNVDSDDIRAALIARLEDSNPDVRGEALMGLALRRDSRTVHAILRELRRPDCTDFAIEAAAELQSEQLVQHLQELLQASPQSQRVRAALDACRNRETA